MEFEQNLATDRSPEIDDAARLAASTRSTTLTPIHEDITPEDNGNDETPHFSGYEFIFSPGGSATASNGSNTVSGTWMTGTDDSQSKLILDFGSTSPFDELNEDWHVLEETSTMIRCEHISGGNGGTDYLTFEKI